MSGSCVAVDESKQCYKNAELPVSELQLLCSGVYSIWFNGYSGSSGKNDRIPYEKTKKIKTSLLLIKPEYLSIDNTCQYEDDEKYVQNLFLKDKNIN